MFFRAKDPAALTKWYDDNFGITVMSETNPEPWQQAAGPTVFQPFDAASDYYLAHQQVMLNFRVADLDAMLEQLEAAGVKIDPTAWTSPMANSPGSTTPRAIRSSSGSHKKPATHVTGPHLLKFGSISHQPQPAPH